MPSDTPRRPHTSPRTLPDELRRLLLDTRRAHPTWGPRKILAYLRRRSRRRDWPAASTVGTLYRRAGLVQGRRRRRPLGHPGRPPTVAHAPNAIWTADLKGWFRTRDGVRCDPLTVVDSYFRYLLAVEALPSQATPGVQQVFECLFRTYGLPERIRTDNGTPFATSALCRLSALSVWWLKLGIVPELIQPAHPEQNGKHERLHKSLKAEAVRPPSAHAAAQHRRFLRFQREYNDVRPHEALGDRTPGELYRPSRRPFPDSVPPIAYPDHFRVYYVSRNGGIRFKKRWVNLSHVLIEEHVGLAEVDDGIWNVYFGTFLLGRFDERDRHIHGAHNRNRLPRTRR